MTTNPPAPPLLHQSSSPSLLSLPDEIIVDCLARISKSEYPSLCSVSKRFYSLLSSPETTRLDHKPEPQSLASINGKIKGESGLVPITPSSSDSPALFASTLVTVGPEIYHIGRQNKKKELSKAVHVFDCRTHTWRRAPGMTVGRKRADCCF
ncbi:unnamed protein product [Microthlaspi erraticum]|uniref:F-box domain-containing protein n=1 Tax=Microthlaspi erraticum TaxID=1685480 RepID=A0A6D2IQV0_9BRAS|nr:unnamed protein product [Microthlaspi erraticum]